MLDSPQDKFYRQRKFDESLREAIDATLTSMGEPVKNTVYFMLESNLTFQKMKFLIISKISPLYYIRPLV